MTLKEYLQQNLKSLTEKRDNLNARLVESDNKEERAEIGATLKTLADEIKAAEDALAEVDKPANDQGGSNGSEGSNEGRGQLDPTAMYRMNNGGTNPEQRTNDPLATMEYRTAFMNYVVNGTKSDLLEHRADQTDSTDLGVLLPTTVVQQIIKDVEKVYGQLYSRVKKTNIKGGVKYPLGSFSATFKRITENTVSEKQAAGGVTGSVQFTYKIGEIRIATSLLASILSVPVFEAELSKVIVEAYVKAMDEEILVGTEEANQCVGIITEAKKAGAGRIPTANTITFTAAELKKWDSWKTKLFANIPLSMRKERPVFIMTANTFESNIETLQDSNGQPVARTITNPVNGDESARFFGREVVFVEALTNAIENFNDAETDHYFGIYMVPEKAYAINTNLQFSVKRYFDEDTNQWIDKAIVINDGKVLDPKYIYLLKKAAAK